MARNRLNKTEAAALIAAGEFLLAGEWTDVLTDKEGKALRAAINKLKERRQKAV